MSGATGAVPGAVTLHAPYATRLSPRAARQKSTAKRLAPSGARQQTELFTAVKPAQCAMKASCTIALTRLPATVSAAIGAVHIVQQNARCALTSPRGAASRRG